MDPSRDVTIWVMANDIVPLKAINEIISRRKFSLQFSTCFKQNNKIYTNKIDIANEINNIYFYGNRP